MNSVCTHPLLNFYIATTSAARKLLRVPYSPTRMHFEDIIETQSRNCYVLPYKTSEYRVLLYHIVIDFVYIPSELWFHHPTSRELWVLCLSLGLFAKTAKNAGDYYFVSLHTAANNSDPLFCAIWPYSTWLYALGHYNMFKTISKKEYKLQVYFGISTSTTTTRR